MESFLAVETSRASRERDESKVTTLGPFAITLGLIVYKRQIERPDTDKLPIGTMLYRGISIPKTHLYSYNQSLSSYKELVYLPGMFSSLLSFTDAFS
jgi:hypothetical protein